MSTARTVLAAACCVLAAVCTGCADASSHPPHARLVLLFQDGLDGERLLDPSDHGPLTPLLPQAAVALVNPVVPRPLTAESEYATLGAGRRLRADPAAGLPVMASVRLEGDPASRVYRRRTGLDPAGAAALHLGIAPLLRSGGDGIGALAEACRSAGRRVGFLEIADPGSRLSGERSTKTATDRSGDRPDSLGPAGLVAMDHFGRIAMAVREPPEAPEAEAERCLRLAQQCDLLVVELPTATEALVAALLPRLDLRTDTLILCSPVPPGSGASATPQPPIRWDRLGWLLAWGRGFVPGRLDSPTTRTPGLVANIDLAPTLLATLDVPLPVTVEGHPMRAAGPASLADLLRFSRLIRLHQAIALPAYLSFALFALFAVLLAVIAVRRSDPDPPQAVSAPQSAAVLDEHRRVFPHPRSATRRLWPRLARGFALLVVAVPLAMLFVPFTYPTTPARYALLMGLSLAVTAFFSVLLARWYGPPVRACLLLLSATLIADLLFDHGRAVALSIFSDFPLSGMRFYGIGNEYMALLVAGLIAATAWRSEWLLVAGILSTVVIGHPAYGASFGGALTAAAGFAVAWWVASRARIDRRRLVWLAAALVALGVGLFLLDALRPEAARSHVGDLAHQIAAKGPSALLDVAVRKLGMNWGIAHTPWFLLAFGGVAFAGFLCYQGMGARARELLARRPDLRAATAGILAVLIVGTVVKDSGVVVAGYTLCVLIALMVSAVLEGA